MTPNNPIPAVEAALDKVQDYAGALEVARNQVPRDNHVIATMRQMLNEARAALLALLRQPEAATDGWAPVAWRYERTKYDGTWTHEPYSWAAMPVPSDELEWAQANPDICRIEYSYQPLKTPLAAPSPTPTTGEACPNCFQPYKCRECHEKEIVASSPEPSGDEAVAVVSASEWRRARAGRTFMAIPGSEADSSGDVLLYTRPVKLPERQELFSDSGTADVAFVRGWNACLDAITHANEGGK